MPPREGLATAGRPWLHLLLRCREHSKAYQQQSPQFSKSFIWLSISVHWEAQTEGKHRLKMVINYPASSALLYTFCALTREQNKTIVFACLTDHDWSYVNDPVIQQICFVSQIFPHVCSPAAMKTHPTSRPACPAGASTSTATGSPAHSEETHPHPQPRLLFTLLSLPLNVPTSGCLGEVRFSRN